MIGARFLVIASLLVSCGRGQPTLSVYHRSTPSAIGVAKTASEPELWIGAARDGTRVELSAKRVSQVGLTRQVHYNAVAMDYVSAGNPLVQLFEFTFALYVVLLPAAHYVSLAEGNSSDDRRVVQHASLLGALVNTRRTVFNYDVEVGLAREGIFADAPTHSAYLVRLPAEGLAVTYRLLDQSGAPVATGQATTDMHGRASVDDVDHRAVVVEVTVAGQTYFAPVLRDVADNRASPERVPAPAPEPP